MSDDRLIHSDMVRKRHTNPVVLIEQGQVSRRFFTEDDAFVENPDSDPDID